MMLVCAVLGSLAFGVLVAYGLCQLMFRLFRMHSMSTAKQRSETAPARVVVEG